MEDSRSSLLSKRIVSENKLFYYLVWINQIYAFCDKNPGNDASAEETDGFVKHYYFYSGMCSTKIWAISKEVFGLLKNAGCRWF